MPCLPRPQEGGQSKQRELARRKAERRERANETHLHALVRGIAEIALARGKAVTFDGKPVKRDGEGNISF